MLKQEQLPFESEANLSVNFRPIHYLGSKLRILDQIDSVVTGINRDGDRVYDLFSGSGSVARTLSAKSSVTAVDIQEYSRVICSALLNPTRFSPDPEELGNQIVSSKFYMDCQFIIEPLEKYERACMEDARRGNNTPLCEFLELGSLIGFELGYGHDCSSTLRTALRKTLERMTTKRMSKASLLTVRHFGGLFLSFSQAAKIDAILHYSSRIPAAFQNSYLASLLSTASEVVNTVGKHFAQPIRPRTREGTPKGNLINAVERDRSLKVFDVFKKWASRFSNLERMGSGHHAVRMDYVDALDSLSPDTKVVYADPPYTRDHYSRFYHALETLALRDDPDVSFSHNKGKFGLSRGVYRTGRHQSPFCIKSEAPLAFGRLFSKVRQKNASLVLSYSPFDTTSLNVHPRMLTISQLRELAKDYFSSVEIVSVGKFSHSKLNSTKHNFKTSYEGEVIIVCRI